MNDTPDITPGLPQDDGTGDLRDPLAFIYEAVAEITPADVRKRLNETLRKSGYQSTRPDPGDVQLGEVLGCPHPGADLDALIEPASASRELTDSTEAVIRAFIAEETFIHAKRETYLQLHGELSELIKAAQADRQEARLSLAAARAEASQSFAMFQQAKAYVDKSLDNANQVIRDAQETSDQIIAEARAMADQIICGAHEQAEKILARIRRHEAEEHARLPVHVIEGSCIGTRVHILDKDVERPGLGDVTAEHPAAHAALARFFAEDWSGDDADIKVRVWQAASRVFRSDPSQDHSQEIGDWLQETTGTWQMVVACAVSLNPISVQGERDYPLVARSDMEDLQERLDEAVANLGGIIERPGLSGHRAEKPNRVIVKGAVPKAIRNS